jgi:hypothetical protein
MLSLEAIEAKFIDTINNGPDVLDPALFAGPLDRVLIGLKTHANTISHARLTALEATFPRLLEHLGQQKFNLLSRSYIETKVTRALDNNAIGQGFADFLDTNGCPTQTSELAQIEWAWLESYHAAEAEPFALDRLAGLSEEEVMEQIVGWHPATRLTPTRAAIAPALRELADYSTAAVLIVRPHAEVRLLPLDEVKSVVAQLAQKTATIGNLLTLVTEQPGEADPIGPVLTLIGAGALIAME